MAGDVGLGVFWTILSFIPFVIGTWCFCYWVFKSVKLSRKFAKYLKSLLYLNWVSIVGFEIGVILIFYETLRNLIVGTDFTKQLQEPDLQWPFMIGMLFYIIGKWLVYFVLYMRLYYTLNKSAYSYNESSYRIIRYLIFTEIFVTLVALGLFLAVDDGPIYIVAQLMAAPFFLLDIGIPVTLNVMFIKKTYQIGKTYFRIASMTSRSNSPPRASTTINTANSQNSKNSQNSQPSIEKRDDSGKTDSKLKGAPRGPEHANSVSGSEDNLGMSNQPSGVDITNGDDTPNVEIKKENETSNNSRDKSATGNNINNNTEISKNTSNISQESEKDLSELFDAISKVAVLSVIIAVSSIGYFLLFFMGTSITVFEPITWIGFSIDACFNMVCLVLAFEFSRKWFNLFCGPFQRCCKNQVAKKAETME